MSIALGLAFVLTAAGAATAYLYQATRTATDHVKHARLMPPQHESDPAGVDNGGGLSKAPVNFLLMGSDAHHASTGRSDTLMLLHLDADRHAAYLISFPRDMYVPIPGHGKNKINSAYAFGGSELTVSTVQQLLGVKIAHAAVVDFPGIVKITQELGGVTINNPYAFTSHGYSYPKGSITLSGDRAMWFVRERYALPHGDLDRTANNRKVVLAILSKGLSARTIRNPVRFNRFVGDLAGSVTVDDGFSNSEMRRLALSLRLTPGDVGELQAPISGFGTVPGVGAVDLVDREKLKELSDALRADDLGRYASAHPGDQ